MATGKHRGLLLGLGIWDVAGGEGVGGGGWAWATAVVVWGGAMRPGVTHPRLFGGQEARLGASTLAVGSGEKDCWE